MRIPTLEEVKNHSAQKSASFNANTLQKVQETLKPCLTDEILDHYNGLLIKAGKRKLKLDDFARIAYVHTRSIREHDGESPYNRIVQYCKSDGHDYSNLHIQHATDFLLLSGYMKLEKEEDRSNHKCRSYSLSPEVVSMLFSKTRP